MSCSYKYTYKYISFKCRAIPLDKSQPAIASVIPRFFVLAGCATRERPYRTQPNRNTVIWRSVSFIFKYRWRWLKIHSCARARALCARVRLNGLLTKISSSLVPGSRSLSSSGPDCSRYACIFIEINAGWRTSPPPSVFFSLRNRESFPFLPFTMLSQTNTSSCRDPSVRSERYANGRLE